MVGTEGGQQQAIKELLRAYDGNPVQAVLAVRDYVERERATPVKTDAHTHRGPVLLNVEDVSKTYKLGRQHLEVLKNVSLQIHKGEFVAITGASGSGKSTLLQLIGGLDKPTSGDIRFGEKSLAKLSDAKLSAFRRQTIGFVFQFFYLQPFLSLERNLEVPGMFARTKRKLRQEYAKELAKSVGLDDRLRHLPKELSGGQMQRAAIARALINQQ